MCNEAGGRAGRCWAATPATPSSGLESLTAWYPHEGVLRSRGVGGVVLCGTLDLPVLPARLLADCEREIVRLGLEAGDVEPLSLARARVRWPGYGRSVQAVSGWMQSLGLADVLVGSDQALMACRGARYHHDAVYYGGKAFCNIFLSDDKGLDLHFPQAGHRIRLTRGLAVIFDTAQPHAVIRRNADGFDAQHFAPGQDCTQLFLTWELPIDNAQLGSALGIRLDIDMPTASQVTLEQGCVLVNGKPGKLCPQTGRWL